MEGAALWRAGAMSLRFSIGSGQIKHLKGAIQSLGKIGESAGWCKSRPPPNTHTHTSRQRIQEQEVGVGGGGAYEKGL